MVAQVNKLGDDHMDASSNFPNPVPCGGCAVLKGATNFMAPALVLATCTAPPTPAPEPPAPVPEPEPAPEPEPPNCLANELGKGILAFDLCFNDEVNGVAVAHAHNGNQVSYNAQGMQTCINNVNGKLGGANAFSAPCLGCLAAGDVTTVADFIACFDGVDITQEQSCSSTEMTSLLSLVNGVRDLPQDARVESIGQCQPCMTKSVVYRHEIIIYNLRARVIGLFRGR